LCTTWDQIYSKAATLIVPLDLLPETEIMKPYLLSLAAGILVGIVYSLLHVRSPAPPLVALVGLLGILGGEQVLPVAKQMLNGAGFHTAWLESDCKEHLFGSLPGTPMRGQRSAKVATASAGDRPENRS
jgi:XapX domain-containing protein